MFSLHAGRTTPTSLPPDHTVTRALLVDDHPVVLSGLADLLRGELGYDIVGTATTPDDARRLATETEPTLAVVDLFLGTSDGLTLVRDLVERAPGLRVLVVSAHDERAYAGRALTAGAHGYVSKRAAPAELLDAVRTVVRGEIAVSPDVRERLVEQYLGRSDAPTVPTALLTDRELEAFRLFGLGLSTAEVADAMEVSTKTVETYRLSVKGKLGLTSNNAFIYRAVLWTLGQDARSAGATAVS